MGLFKPVFAIPPPHVLITTSLLQCHMPLSLPCPDGSDVGELQEWELGWAVAVAQIDSDGARTPESDEPEALLPQGTPGRY